MLDSDVESPPGVMYITGFSHALKINYTFIKITLECRNS